MSNVKIKNSRLLNLLIILSFVALSLLSIIFLYHTHILFGASDMAFHTKRIIELRESIEHGNILPRYSINEFNGSSVMTMYPYIDLLPIVLLSFFIRSGIKLLYFAFVFNTFIMFIISYYCSVNYNKSRFISYFFSIFYCTSTLYLDYGFLNMDLGMLSVITFLPLIIFGFLHLVYYKTWVELSIGMTLIMFSHVLSVVILSVFLLLWLIINYKNINIKLIRCLAKAVTVTILVTAIFWYPFIRLILLNMNNMNRPGSINLFGTSLVNVISSAFLGKGSYSISIIPIIGLIISFILFKYLNKNEKQMLVLSTIIIIGCSKIIPWNITSYGVFKIFKVFQFTWRFYIIPQIFLCYIAAVCVKIIYNQINLPYLRKLFILITVLFPISFQMLSQVAIVNNNINSNGLTKKLINTHMTSLNIPQDIHHNIVYFRTINLPHSKNMKRPPLYKVVNQHQYDILTSPYLVLGGIDYYPMGVLPKLDDVVNNYAFVHNYKVLIKHDGYNDISLVNNNDNKSITLPIVRYRGEDLIVRVNGKSIQKPLTSRYDLIRITSLKKGLNHVKINVVNNVFEIFIEITLFIIGILIYIYEIIRIKKGCCYK